MRLCAHKGATTICSYVLALYTAISFSPFRRVRTAAKSASYPCHLRPFVRPHVPARLSLGGFREILIVGIIIKIQLQLESGNLHEDLSTFYCYRPY